MSKLFKLGFTNGIQSLFPVILWAVLPLLFNDTIYAEGYIVSYPYQYIGMIMYESLVKSQLKYEKKNHISGNRYAVTGLTILYLFSIVVFGGSVALWDSISSVLNLEDEYFRLFCFSVWNLQIDWVLMGVCTLYQYRDNNKSAFLLAMVWHSSKIILLTALGYFIGSYIAMFVVGVLFGIILLILIIRFGVGKYVFNISSIKYGVDGLSSSFGMFVTYVFGIRNMASAGVLAAYNIMSMCTDTQWDILDSAIDTDTTLSIVDNGYNKKLFINHLIFSIVLFLSGVATIFIINCFPIYRDSIDFNYVWIVFLLECSWFPVYSVSYTMSSWIVLMHPNMGLAYINIIKYVVRASVTIYCISDYGVTIAMICAAVIGNLSKIVMYFYYKRKDMVKCQLNY